MRSHGFDLLAEVVHIDIHHGVWVSSAELQRASVTRMNPKPQLTAPSMVASMPTSVSAAGDDDGIDPGARSCWSVPVQGEYAC